MFVCFAKTPPPPISPLVPESGATAFLQAASPLKMCHLLEETSLGDDSRCCVRRRLPPFSPFAPGLFPCEVVRVVCEDTVYHRTSILHRLLRTSHRCHAEYGVSICYQPARRTCGMMLSLRDGPNGLLRTGGYRKRDSCDLWCHFVLYMVDRPEW
jgi:hypothetical protein